MRFLIPRGRRVAASTRRTGRSGIRRRTRRCSTRLRRASAPAPNRKLIRLPQQHQRSGIRRRTGRGVQRHRPARAIERGGMRIRPPWPASRARRSSKKLRAMVAPRRADHRRRRRHRPVREVRGGGRHRPDRDLQLGPLPHGRARLAGGPDGLRQRQRHRGGHGARGAAGGQGHAGARGRQRHRSVHDPRPLPAPSSPTLGFSGVQNFPTVGLFDGVIRAQLEETGMGYGARGRHDPGRARARSADHALRVQRAGCDRTWRRRAPTSSSATWA